MSDQKTTRRKFLKTSLGLAATAIAAGGSYRALAQVVDSAGVDIDAFTLPKVSLGQTNLTPSLLGIGTGTNGWGGRSAQTELGRKQLVSLLEYAYDRGVTYFDLADQYGTHPFMRTALSTGGGSIDRDKCFLLTKSHARTKEGMKADVDRFRKEIGTDHLDLVLLHCKFGADWSETHAGAMEALSELREQGVVKAHGVSCHSFSALKTASETPWVQVDLARLNPWGVQMDSDVDSVKEVLTTMRQKNKGVIGMKILGAGSASKPEKVEEGIKHALECGLLDCFTVGIKTRQELDELLGLIGKYYSSA